MGGFKSFSSYYRCEREELGVTAPAQGKQWTGIGFQPFYVLLGTTTNCWWALMRVDAAGNVIELQLQLSD